MNRTILLLITLIVIIGSAFATYYINTRKTTEYQAGVSAEFDRAAQMALAQYKIKQKTGIDFRPGPCLDDNLMPNWVADIVHNPRIKSDSLPENQCPNFLSGKAKHFVELDVDGNVVKVQ